MIFYSSFVCLAILLFTILLAFVLGNYISKVFKEEKTFLDFLNPLEDAILRFCKVDGNVGMDWKTYLFAVLAINIVWLFWAFGILLVQHELFLNPAGNPSMPWTLALNSAISFVTSTNLQHYSGETGATYLSQMIVFMFLQFVSAGTSLACGIAVTRGLAGKTGEAIGNFYRDLVVSITRIFLPISVVVAFLFLLRGVPMTFQGTQTLSGLEGASMHVATGPLAAMLPIKDLGSNGGGFFAVNDAHPFENTDFFTLVIHVICIFLLPIAFIFCIKNFINSKQFSYMVFGVMTAGFLLLTVPIILQELKGNPKLISLGIANTMGNMEGKELRYGDFYTSFYSGVNIAIPAGSVTGMHDSYLPISGLFMLAGMQIDCFYGGVGTGWINFFLYIIIAVFLGSLMIGRTPELLGKKIAIEEMQIVARVSVIWFLIPIGLAAVASHIYSHMGGDKLGWLTNKGHHGFTSILYEYVSSMAGNGSEFSGLLANTPFWNLTTSLAMMIGRFVPIAAALKIVGLLREKIYIPPSPGSLNIACVTFGVFLLVLILVLNTLSLLPAFILGPTADFFDCRV